MRLDIELDTTAPQVLDAEISGDPQRQISTDFESLYSRGVSAAQKGDREAARAALLAASESDPANSDVWMWLASISEYPEELLAFLKRVLDIDPDNTRALEWRSATTSLLAKTLVQRAVAAHEGGSRELAVQCLDDAIELDQNCEMAWFWKASLSNIDEQKSRYLEHVLEINPDNQIARAALESINGSRYEAMMNEARAAAVTDDQTHALGLLEKLIEQRPDNVEAWMLRSYLSSDFEAKVDSLKKVLELETDNAAARSAYDFLAGMKASATPGSAMAAADHLKFADVPVFEEDASSTVPYSDFHAQDDEGVGLYVVPPVERTSDEPTWPEKEMEPVYADTSDPYAFLEDSQPVEKDADPTDDATFETEPQIIETVTAEYDIRVIGDQPVAAESTYHVDFDENSSCPFCFATNDQQAFECGSCHAMLTLSDLESLLDNSRVDHDVVQQAVTRMEAEWNFRDFSEEELTSLGIGHLNLRNFEAGHKYLEEAYRLSPNNVILSGQVRAIAIRMDELAHQSNGCGSMPVGKTILVVDDSPTVRKLISGKLEKSGHHVVCAEDGVQALARMKERLPDLVLLDITMPRMDGYEVCKHIRADPAARDLPVVMISGKDGFFDKVRGRMAGTTGYVTKPFGPETLMKALETYLIPDKAPIG